MNYKDIVDCYLKIFPNELKRQERLLEALNQKENNIIDWNNFEGHVVASGFVYSRKLKKFLVIYHKDLKTYLYPGGHIDDFDSSSLDAAIREVYEETGLDNLEIKSFSDNKFIPIDIDTHLIPFNERLNLPQHLHFDFRYLFVLNDEKEIKIDESESLDFKWISLSHLRVCISSNDIIKKIEKLIF